MTPDYRILLVDADYDACDALCERLRAAGYETDFAYDPDSAVESARQQDYDLVLLVHWLPYINAPALYRRLRRVCPDASAVLAGDRLTRETIAAARQAGIAHIQPGPPDLASLEQLAVPPCEAVPA